MNSKLLTVSSSLATLLAAQGVFAQTDAESDRALQDIVVTATRQSTNLQDTPLAITAVTSQTLNDRGLARIADLSAAVPNATFRRTQGAFGPGVSAFIRGIGQSDTGLGSEPSVAYYVDDVYYPLLLGSNFDLLDLDHVEVLRGPQGTLFGRNALAGAVNIVSRQPSFDQISATVEMSTGSYSRLDLRTSVNLPLTDNLAISVGGLMKSRKGYQKRLDFRCQMIANGTPERAGTFPYFDVLTVKGGSFTPDNCTIGRLGGENVRAGRISARWEPMAGVSLTLSGDYTKDESENPADQLIAVPAPSAASASVQSGANFIGGPGFAYDSRFVTGNPFLTYATYADPIGAGTVIPGNGFWNGFSSFGNGIARGGQKFDPHTNLVNWGVSGKLVVALSPEIDAIAIAGYRKVDTTYMFDVDGSPLVIEHTYSNIGEDYTNLELRLAGKMDWINWVVGGFYFEASGFNHAITYTPQNVALRLQNTTYKPSSKALFANTTLRPFGERLGITLGGRYSDDRKAVDFNNSTDTGANNIIFKVTPAETRWDWKVGADYQVDDDIMVFASISTGARLPGFNARPLQPSQIVSFPGEETLAYEAGIKADLLDRKLRINATAFYTDYKTRITTVSGQEYQIGGGGQPSPGGSLTVPLPQGGAGATTCRPLTPAEITAGTPGFLCIGRNYYVNTPGKAKGFEVEIEAKPIDGLSINGSIGYARFSSPDLQLASRANDRVVGIPEWNANAGIQYRVPVDMLDGTITPRLDWFYTGNIAMSANRNTYNQPAYSVFNLRVSYENKAHEFTIAAGATNLFNKIYYRNFFVYQDIGFPNVNAQPAPPREWFLTFSKQF